MNGAMRVRLSAAALPLALVSSLFAAEAAASELGSKRSGIVGGVAASDDAVVALTYGGHAFCSGTVVSRRTVVTAAHCLPPNLDLPIDGIEVFFGDELREDGGTFVPIVDALADPSWSEDSMPGDIGVVALAEDAPVEPVPMAYGALQPWIEDQQVRLVGFGITARDGGGGGIKRQGTSRIIGVDDSNLYMGPEPAVTCNGDSGGPLFAVENGVEVLAGVHSRSDCDERSIAERIDVHAMSFVLPFIEEHEGPASCEADGLCAIDCGEPDPDCPCSADGLCTDACPVPEADLDCEADLCADGDCEPTGHDGELGGAVTSGGCAAGGTGTSAASLLALMALAVHARRRARATVRS